MARTSYPGRKWAKLSSCYEAIKAKYNQRASRVECIPMGRERVKVIIDFPDSTPRRIEIWDKTGMLDSEQEKFFGKIYKEPEGGKFDKGERVLIKTVDTLKNLLSFILVKRLDWSMDVETTGLHPKNDYPVGYSVCHKSEGKWVSYYIPVRHEDYEGNIVDGFEIRHLADLIKENPPIMFCASFDVRQLVKEGLPGLCRSDVMLNCQIVGRPERKLKDMAKNILKAAVVNLDDMFNPDEFHFGMFDPEETDAYLYACDDVIYTLALYEWVKERAIWDDKLLGIARMELAIAVGPYREMETRGVYVDRKTVEGSIEVYTEKRDTAYDLVFGVAEEMLGEELERFKLNSTKKLAELLFDKLGYAPIVYTGKGAASTSIPALEALSGSAIIDAILDYKHVKTILETYLQKVFKYLDDEGRAYWAFSQIGQSGRTYTFGPNVQQWPWELRKAVLPDPGNFFLLADYKAQELRILAALSGETTLIDAIHQGLDLHKNTFSMMTGTPLEDVTEEERELGKVLNYAPLYGAEARKISEKLRVSEAVAQKLLDKFFGAMPEVVKWKILTLRQSKASQSVRTYFGRWRELENISARQRHIRGKDERRAGNTKIQGTAADLMKRAILRLRRELPSDVIMVLPVHDSMLFQVPDHFRSKVGEIMNLISDTMAEEINGVVFEVDFKMGDNWGSLEKIS